MVRFEPSAEACDRKVVLALLRFDRTLLVAELSMKSVPEFNFARPRPEELKVTPTMLMVDLPVSLDVSFRVSPPSRLTPLNEASWDVVLIWSRMLLYWATRLARVVCATGSATGAAGMVKVCVVVSVPPIEPPDVPPSVEDAKSFEAEICSLPLASTVAVRLLACSAELSWASDLTVPLVPSPKVTLTAAPPLKEVKVKVLPLTPPAFDPRAAVKALAVPVEPVRPSADRALPVPVTLRSDEVPVEIFRAPVALPVELVDPEAVASVAPDTPRAAVCTPVARSIAVSTSETVPFCR